MRLSQLLFLSIICFSVLIPAVSASSASTTAQQVNTLLDKKTPYTIELTESQMTTAGFNSSGLDNPGTYKITIKSAKYDAKEEALVLNINAWRNGKSVKVNNPVHFYMPWSGGIHGANAAAQLQNYGFVLIRFLDGLPLGEPVNDDTLLVYASNDAYVRQGVAAGTTWQALRDGGGNGNSNNPAASGNTYLTAHATDAGEYTYLYRYAFTWNTSTIGSSSTVTSAVARFKYGAKITSLLGQNETTLLVGTPGNPSLYASGDYDNVTLSTSNELAPRYDFTSTTTGNVNYTLNAIGLSNISKTGNTVFYALDGDEVDNSFSGVWAGGAVRRLQTVGVSDATEANRPYLQIIYTPAGGGDTTPPLSIAGLTNTTGCSWIKWDWTNPADSDFNHTYVLKDNVFYTNVSNATATLNWTGLSELTAYTFSSKTVDITGNINATWVNLSSTTTSCPVVTPTPTATPTPEPTPIPLGCSYINATGLVVVGNYTNLTSTIGNISWGTTVWNVTQGNVSWWTCLIATPTPTPTPIISRLIVNPSIESQPFFCRFSLTRWTPLCPKE